MNTQIVMDGDNPRTRYTDPETSHEAADRNAARIQESQSWVYMLFTVHGPMADHQLQTRSDSERAHRIDMGANDWSPSRLRTARHELTESGQVIDTGIYRLTPSGRRTIEGQHGVTAPQEGIREWLIY
jgi:hypothetical protein